MEVSKDYNKYKKEVQRRKRFIPMWEEGKAIKGGFKGDWTGNGLQSR